MEREPERVAAQVKQWMARGLTMAPSRHASATRADSAKLTGPQKAAVLLVAIGEERAGEIFRHLGETEVEALSLEIAKARKVPTDDLPRRVSTRPSRPCWPRTTSPRAASTTPARCSSARSAPTAPRRSSAAWPRRSSAGRSSSCAARRPSRSHVFLRNESPQTIALVVANLHTTLAAQVLSLLEPEEQAEVALRIAHDGRDAAGGRRARSRP